MDMILRAELEHAVREQYFRFEVEIVKLNQSVQSSEPL